MYSFSVPNAVTDLLVYTKNESSASLRWKPPYPPRGVLEKYNINYRHNKHSNRIKNLNSDVLQSMAGFSLCHGVKFGKWRNIHIYSA
jgi:hypothetical protein